MEQSPLQVYKKAYDLHYKEKKLLDASTLYQNIIQNFPDTDVSVYASLQLSKIKSNRVSTSISKKKSSSGWLLWLFISINLILTAGIISILGFNIQTISKQQATQSKISQTVSKLYAGNEDEALSLLNELKISTRNDITPFVLAADIYLKRDDFSKAREEYKAFQNLYPGNPLVIAGIKEINKEEAVYLEIKKREKKLKEEREAKEEEVKKKEEMKKTRYKEPEPPPKIINKKDITYF